MWCRRYAITKLDGLILSFHHLQGRLLTGFHCRNLCIVFWNISSHSDGWIYILKVCGLSCLVTNVAYVHVTYFCILPSKLKNVNFHIAVYNGQKMYVQTYNGEILFLLFTLLRDQFSHLQINSTTAITYTTTILISIISCIDRVNNAIYLCISCTAYNPFSFLSFGFSYHFIFSFFFFLRISQILHYILEVLSSSENKSVIFFWLDVMLSMLCMQDFLIFAFSQYCSFIHVMQNHKFKSISKNTK